MSSHRPSGPYTVQHRLGRGGMGVVDLALDDDGRFVALKRLVLHGSAADMARARTRIRREAEALTRLDHPNIVPLLDVVDDGDELVLVMPYLAGGSLADAVRSGGLLSDGQVRAMAGPLLDALASAHRHGIVHRDVKPANVLFDDEGRPYLADFGTARLRDVTDGLTVAGTLLGTPEFMSPEQARGESVSSASDVFSMGATLAWARTGVGPWGPPGGEPLAIIRRAATANANRVSRDLAPDLRQLLTALTTRRPDRRPSAAEAARSLGTDALTSVAPKRGTSRRDLRPMAGIAASVLLVFSGVAGVAWSRADRSGSAASASPLTTQNDRPVPSSSPTTAPCTDLPYQPCGQPSAPNTDGLRCLGDTADYDGDPETGCEAEALPGDGDAFTARLEANLVPHDDVDRYPMVVEDRWQLLCDGTLHVTLTAPAGVAMRLDVLDGSDRLGTAVSQDERTATLSLREPSCANDDSTTLTAQVSWEGEARSAAPYVLSRRGSW